MNITVLGNGGFGTAMALSQHRAGRKVRVLGHDHVYTSAIAATGRNPRYLPEVELPPELLFTADPVVALRDADLVLAAVPTQHLRETLLELESVMPDSVPLVSLAKGLEQGSGLRPSEVLQEVFPASPILCLSGPSHAEEIARNLPALVVIAGANEEVRRLVQTALTNETLRVYRNEDLLGVELCGALKNVIALAAGIAEGLGLGDNAKAAILARGLFEMTRFGLAEGARPETFHGLAGVGDLAVTAFSKHGRNRAFGERLGRGETLEQILESTQKVAEGVWTSRVVQERARDLGIEMPLTDAVCSVLFGGLTPEAAVRALMERAQRDETD